jgi:hypothetical protein
MPNTHTTDSGVALLLGQPGQLESMVDQCLDHMVG